MTPPFELDPRLTADSHFVGDLALSSLLLFNDSRFLWTVLVPRIPNKRDLIDLSAEDQSRLTTEIDAVARAVRELGRAEKLNVASLGNMVAQLHVHVIARRADDAAWPKPVWGVGEPEPYDDAQAAAKAAALRNAVGL